MLVSHELKSHSRISKYAEYAENPPQASPSPQHPASASGKQSTHFPGSGSQCSDHLSWVAQHLQQDSELLFFPLGSFLALSSIAEETKC